MDTNIELTIDNNEEFTLEYDTDSINCICSGSTSINLKVEADGEWEVEDDELTLSKNDIKYEVCGDKIEEEKKKVEFKYKLSTDGKKLQLISTDNEDYIIEFES